MALGPKVLLASACASSNVFSLLALVTTGCAFTSGLTTTLSVIALSTSGIAFCITGVLVLIFDHTGASTWIPSCAFGNSSIIYPPCLYL